MDREEVGVHFTSECPEMQSGQQVWARIPLIPDLVRPDPASSMHSWMSHYCLAE